MGEQKHKNAPDFAVVQVKPIKRFGKKSDAEQRKLKWRKAQ
ncbi:hypothetical protein [Bacillus spizizenii]|nr:hypothetical protein [Bacillus spizizenii]